MTFLFVFCSCGFFACLLACSRNPHAFIAFLFPLIAELAIEYRIITESNTLGKYYIGNKSKCVVVLSLETP